MKSFHKNNKFIFCIDEYKNFNKEFKEIMKQISNYNLENEKQMNNLLEIDEENVFLIEYILFSNYEKWINTNIDLDTCNKDNNQFQEYFKKYKIYNKSVSNEKIIQALFHMYLFLVLKMIKGIQALAVNSEDQLIIENNIKIINHSYHILFQIFILVAKLYYENECHIKYILLFFDALSFFIKKEDDIINDKYIKIKNKILYELLFDFYGKISLILFKGIENKKDLLVFVNYLKEYLGNNILNSNFDIAILTTYNIFQKFMIIFLNNFNYSNLFHKDTYQLYKTEMIDIFANIYGRIINNSKFLEILINQNKDSFVNLYNFTKNKELIINDIYLQSFYIELLSKIYENEKNKIYNGKTFICPPTNSFIFNGYNSRMTIKLNNFQLDNSFLFFSFHFNDNINNSKSNLPLLIFENELNNEILFKIYIKKIINPESHETQMKLAVYQENKKGKIKKDIPLEQIDDIKFNTNYFIGLYFNGKKLCINIRSVNINRSKYHQEVAINNIINNRCNLKIGHNGDENEYFKGYIGSIIIIKQLSLIKGVNYEDIIYNILKLKEYYKFFPYFICKKTKYKFNNIVSFYPNENDYLFSNIKKFLQKNIIEFDCFLYLTPEIIDVYYSLMDKYLPFHYLPCVPDICESQRLDDILDMNISLTNFDSVYIDFLRNNGFDYICLIYEYFYQFSNLYMLNKDNFKLGPSEENMKKIIINSISKTLIILKNYNTCKFVNQFETSLKKMYKNLSDCLKSLNEIWNIITEDIISNLYELVFTFIENIITNKEEKNLIVEVEYNNNKLMSFSDGLIDILFDIELYKKYKDKNPIYLLFLFVSSFLINFIKNTENKFVPSKYEFFWKILNFTEILDKFFTDDYKNKNKIISSFFHLLDNFFMSIKDDKSSSSYFKKLLHFSLANFQNNLVITYNYLCFIHEMIWKGYTLEEEDIILLINFSNKYYIKDKDIEDIDNKLIDNIFSTVSCILINVIMNKESTIIVDEAYKKLISFSDNQVILPYITNEIRKIIEIVIQNKSPGIYLNKNEIKYYKNNIKDNMRFYWNIFSFIISLFKNLIVEHVINYDDDKTDKKEKIIIYKLKNNVHFSHIYTLLINIEEILRFNNINSIDYIHSIYCLINFVKFYHYVIFNEKNILKFLEIEFIDNLLQVINLCSKFYYIISCGRLFTVEIDESYYNKTIIEIIFDLYIQYFLNDINKIECYNNLLKFIFFETDIVKDKACTIFYANDYFRYLFYNKKNIKNENSILLHKYDIIFNYNDKIFKNEELFNNNFTTFFLLKTGGYIFFLNNIKNSKEAPIQELKKHINVLYSNILEEHQYLYELNKDFFFKQINSTNNYYIDLIKSLKKYIKKKKSANEEIKQIFDNNIKQISDKMYKNLTSGFLITNKKENEKEKTMFFLRKKSVKSNLKDYTISPKINDSKDIQKQPEIEKDNNTYIKIEPIKVPNNINIITYFNDLDTSFLKNTKKEIMNNIFSIYYIDIFFHNDAFCKMRDYFINNYLDSSYSKYIKQLDFPSKIKNYSNNLECPLFIKQYNDYFNSPIFPITHSYINDNNKTIISNYKAIKLLQKKFPTIELGKKNKYECELIKNENYYYGSIFQSDTSNYLLFQEEDINIKEYETGYKYLFLLSWFYENQNKKGKKENEKYIVKKNKKKVLIIFDEIEEIVERRILLLWKGVEIFLKNGKSYIFNFLNTSQFENFMKIFNNKSKKNIIRKKDIFNEVKNIVSEWKKNLINNYDYILLLNRFSSRSFNDANQYPVFPWILLKCIHLKDFNEKENLYEEALKEQLRQNIEKDQFYQNKNQKNSNNTNNNLENEKLLKEIKVYVRNFKFPPSLQTRDKREESIIKYENDEGNGDFPVHSGCHYSTSAYIYFYLMRQQPFCDLLVKLQGYSLENTNRCFISLSTVEFILENGKDNRELIPEFFSKIEFFLNLNCEHYGYLSNENIIMDDALIDIFYENEKNKSNKYPLSNYVHFILEHKKLLNSKVIGYHINKWIDNIFGINQLSENEKIRKSSCNIFHQYSYEQTINLEKKLEEEIGKNINEKQIKDDLSIIINYILNFGQTPYQIFNESHCELKLLSSKNEKTNEFEKEEPNINKLDEEDEEDEDLESIINNSVRNETLNIPINGIPLYFQINPIINKIFVYNNKGNIIVLDCEIFNKKDFSFYDLSNYSTIEKSNIFFYGVINQYLIYKLKYAFSSFDNQLLINNNLDPYHTYYTDMMNNINEKKNIIHKIKNTIKTNQSNKENKLFLFMTGRHIDYSFKIHILRKSNKNKITKETKYFSFICEDFVCSCCTVSNNQFILGLKNGKLIYYYLNIIINENNDKNNKTKNKTENDILSNIKIKLDKKRYIQGHKGKINVIEIDKRIGVVITSGDDNYIFIRKLYDFELLLPIKIKSKYIVLMCKISSFNFLYILCYNKIKNKTAIFGYTLAGLKFAKSEYGLYDNISFTGKGNIVTMDDKKNIITLSGYNLSRLKICDDNEKIEIIKKINNSNWTQFDSFVRKFDDDITKIITYFSSNEKNINIIQTLNVKNIKYFD